MKFKTTKKAINAGYTNRIIIPYCDLQSLLQYKNPVAYTTRAEGWGADIYEIAPNTAIITGYAPFGNIRPAWDIVKKYETAAQRVLYSTPWQEREKELDKLLKEFIAVVTC